jgi:hypothetical protein
MRSRRAIAFLLLPLLAGTSATRASAPGLVVVDFTKLDRYSYAEPRW